MAFVSWPSNLPDPEAPFKGLLTKPLDFSQNNDLGAFESTRRFTRGIVTGSATLYLDNNSDPLLSKFNILRTFWRVTLNDGLAYFKADWTSILGYDGYVVRMTTFPTAMQGSLPIFRMNMELKPFLRLSATEGLPSPWPSKANA
ncbi:hypothetical protein COB55_04890 [Candidatus Wolfebacteria bacterium]|nr:MAG: hypothetical protein COB55_04890 [Candidatus Wolfebacteria bacterium]